MSDCFVYTDKPVVESGSLTWTNQVALSTSFNVSNNGDCSITDSANDSYATAIDENETQYLSVLETTNDVTLEDLHNLTIGNPKLIEQDNLQSESANVPEDGDVNLTNSGDQQIVIFNMEGSEDLYGIQFAQDEEGNMQKYQFQVRTNVDGQYEAIEETIQLLPPEENQASEDLQEDINKHTYESADEYDKTLEEVVYETQVYVNDETEENTDTQIYLQNEENVIEEIQTEEENHSHEETVFVYIKSESTTEKNEIELEEPDFDLENNENVEENETIDVKPGLIEASLTTSIKQEYNMQNQLAQEVENQNEIIYEAHDLPEEHSQEILSQDYNSEDAYDDVGDGGTVLEYQHFDTQHIEEEEEQTGLFDEEGSPTDEGSAEDDSDSDSYEMEDGPHVTAEGDISGESSSADYQTLETIYQDQEQEEPTDPSEKQIICSTNILKQPTNASSVDNFNNKTILYYMITSADQKENVISMPLDDSVLSVKPNPRSLLKNATETVGETNCFHPHPEATSAAPLRAKERPKDAKKHPTQKRLARSSESTQAKLFNNFINTTTIAQAPVRQGRLPRKQEIRPVDTRRDEEIIVKEVMVSSKGFVENVNDRFNSKDKLEVTSIVELTDSEEERDPRLAAGRKKKKKKPLVAVDGAGVIEILQSDEEAGGPEGGRRGPGRPRRSAASTADGAKRPRGRPPKGAAASPQKRTRSGAAGRQGKTEFDCPHCSKPFPSSNSLSTHIQHHNLENSLKSAKAAPIEYGHKCDTCQATFKNGILLRRHVCPKTFKRGSKPKCAICSKSFEDAAALDVHKRAHLKENVVKNTATVTVSPKKFRPRPSVVDKFKSPKKVVGAYKCKVCPKVCPSQGAVTAHERGHRSHACPTCQSSFPSKLLLDTHVRTSCVKAGSPRDKRLSFKIRKSFVSSPSRGRLSRATGSAARFGSRLSVVPNRTSMIPNRTSVVPNRTSVVPNKTSGIPNRTSTVPNKTPAVPNKTPAVASRIPSVSSRTPAVPSKLLAVPSKAIVSSRASMVPSSEPEKPSGSLNKTSAIFSKPLDMKAQCSLCQMKFSTMTALFKHEVREHNVNTPDKKVLLPDKKLLHKPLHEHGGIPMHCRLNKVFQGFRKKLETDTTADVTVLDKSDEK